LLEAATMERKILLSERARTGFEWVSVSVVKIVGMIYKNRHALTDTVSFRSFWAPLPTDSLPFIQLIHNNNCKSWAQTQNSNLVWDQHRVGCSSFLFHNYDSYSYVHILCASMSYYYYDPWTSRLSQTQSSSVNCQLSIIPTWRNLYYMGLW
jgi:hypothetical protein